MRLVWEIKVANSLLEEVTTKNVLAENITEAMRKAEEWLKEYYKNEYGHFIAEIRAIQKVDL